MNEFGGPWTERKLAALRDYLNAYMTIMRKNERARFFRTTYFDGFAGSGGRVLGKLAGPDLLSEDEPESSAFASGSARIALGLDQPFDQYIFVDSRRECVLALENLKREHAHLSIDVRLGDANEEIRNWILTLNKFDRALVFLDPYGMQVEWTTLEALAKTRKTDLWLLFPLGQAVARLLTQGEPPPTWAAALDRLFGTHDWRDRFYKESSQMTLFDETEVRQRDANYGKITEFMVERLRTIFVDALHEPIVLSNSLGVPIYLLCFAVSNERGANPAMSIARDIARKFNAN